MDRASVGFVRAVEDRRRTKSTVAKKARQEGGRRWEG
ncbi:hypothetical protein L288_19415 [Sphingobium quisquiliarum P25]|uniref:Uncharacterized protein n=1 Tax=Sphingobium quisquiliarum P25 TaxID=1329909 RepID=T0GHT5_9SPHN|nr:hypothetical protein L288_19415 [Sphingobium quisquiliarum P25]